MQTISKKDSEIYTLPDGSSILPTDTHHVSYHKHTPITALGSDVHQWLETVFSSDYSISREDMESLLRVLNIRWQKKALQGYFFKLLWEESFADEHIQLEWKINSFPEKNWKDTDWKVFGELAPQKLSWKPKNWGTNGRTNALGTFSRWFDHITALYTWDNREMIGRD